MPPSVHASPAPKLSALAAPLLVRAAALWILVVSYIKMTKGSPGAIPLVIRENALNPFGEDATFFLTLSIEFAFSLVALYSTRAGWWLMSALLAVFLAVLAHLIYIGAVSCGCFGGAIKFSPYQMLAVDGPLFLGLMLSRKGAWSSKAPMRWATIGAALLVGGTAPWIYGSFLDGGPAPTPPADVRPDADAAPAPGAAAGAASEGDEPVTTRAPSGPWTLPGKKPRWVKLRPNEWVGRSIHETELAVWLDTRSQLDTANWILYLETCTHCRDFLNWTAAAFNNDPKVYVLVKLATKDDEVESIIQQAPPHESAALPPDIQWVVGPELPPWELVLEDGVVVEAIHHDINESGLDKQKRWRLQGGAIVESQNQMQF